VRALEGAAGGVGAPLCLSPDGRLLAAAEPGRLAGPAQAVRVYETLTGGKLARLEADLGYGLALAFSLDGRLLAAAGTDALHVWESATGRRLLRLEARGRLPNWTPAGFATCLAFAPGGEALATGHGDGTILLWDLSAARKGLSAPPGKVDAPACREELAAADPVRAYTAIERLAGAPGPAVALLREGLAPVTVDRAWLAARLADLDSSSFVKRETAARELNRVAEAVESELRRALEGARSLETRRRLQGILDRLAANQPGVPPPSELRRLRAVAVLERIGSDEARGLLGKLAGGAQQATLTREARAALDRLARRQALGGRR
jgi:hypothetical protein